MSTDNLVLGPPVVEAIDVHHHYGDGPQRVDVLYDINMQVREGEVVIVTGPSGSGKTTLLTILGTMRRPSEGRLRLLGLGDKADAWPDELSGGQQQRVAIARVMIGLPDLIIADEPTSALDRVSGRVVVDQLKDLAMRAKCAVVLSTHDERIFDVATRRLHIEDGRCFEVPIHYH